MSGREVAVVVGVGPGLGAAVAERFARGGLAVGLVARGGGELARVEEAITLGGGEAVSAQADATDEGALREALALVRERLGPPSVLVYNAGAFRVGSVLEVSAEEFESSWRVNCLGAFLAAREVLPAMVERGRGTILLTGATASRRGAARFSCLAVGKFGLRALAESMARELGPRGVHVAHVIIDGQIDTPRVRAANPGRLGETLLFPEAIAETYWQLHQQDPTAWTLELDLRPAPEKF